MAGGAETKPWKRPVSHRVPVKQRNLCISFGANYQTGNSAGAVQNMSKFASTYLDEQFVQTVSAQIPWSHNVAILDKVKGEKQREWYIRKTAENG